MQLSATGGWGLGPHTRRHLTRQAPSCGANTSSYQPMLRNPCVPSAAITKNVYQERTTARVSV